jgi:hypothetical protein
LSRNVGHTPSTSVASVTISGSPVRVRSPGTVPPAAMKRATVRARDQVPDGSDTAAPSGGS